MIDWGHWGQILICIKWHAPNQSLSHHMSSIESCLAGIYVQDQAKDDSGIWFNDFFQVRSIFQAAQ